MSDRSNTLPLDFDQWMANELSTMSDDDPAPGKELFDRFIRQFPPRDEHWMVLSYYAWDVVDRSSKPEVAPEAEKFEALTTWADQTLHQASDGERLQRQENHRQENC